jgi:hypothetical protein
MLRWLAADDCAPFCALAEQDAVIGEDADRKAADMRKATDQLCP